VTVLDAWNAQLQRELGTEPRKFSSVSAALVWFVEQRGRRMGRSLNLGGASSPSSREQMDQAQRTYAAIVPCLAEHHPADLPDEPLAHAQDPRVAKAEAERRIAELARWFVISEVGAGMYEGGGKVRFADEMGMSIQACDRYCRAIARVLRRRMEWAGLIQEREAA
jgi:hypothetical protein